MCRVAVALALLAGPMTACAKHGEPASAPRIEELSIEPAGAPREPAVLVAGEAARVGLRIRGGRAPYRVELSSEPLTGALSAAPTADDATGVETALRVPVARDATAGRHTLTVTVTDAGGAAVTEQRTLQLAGRGSEQAPEPAQPPWLTVEDVAGRRRTDLYRGERVTIRGRLAEPGAYRLALTGPDGAGVTAATGDADDGAVEMPFDIPRLARPGDYQLALSAGDASATARFRVVGAPYPAVARLTADALTIYGGADRRADRRARLRRGETVRIELRVGGVRALVATALRVRDRAGELVASAALATAQPASRAPDARMFVTGEWTVPASLAPGRYVLEVTASEGDEQSSVYREVAIE